MSEPVPEPVDVPEPEEDAWTGPSQDEWMQTQAALAQANELVQAVNAARSQQDGPLSSYDPEFRQELDQYLAQRLTPYEEQRQAQEAAQTEELMKDAFHDLSVRDGEFDIQMARQRFDQLAPQFVQRYGMTEKAAQKTVEAAAAEQRDYEAALMQRGQEQYMNQMRGLSQARREPPAAGAPAASVHVTPQGGNEVDLVRQYAADGRFNNG